jgi:hypothetical protein
MISGMASTFFFLHSIAASTIARDLHLEDLGIGDRQAAAAVAEHRVHLVQLRRRALDLLGRDAQLLGEFGLALALVRAGTRAAAGRAGGW